MKNRYREEETFGYYNRGEILIKFDHHLDFMIKQILMKLSTVSHLMGSRTRY